MKSASMKIQLIAVLIASALCLQGAVAARAATCVSAGAAGSAEGAKKRNKREKTVEAGIRVFTIKAKMRATDEDRAAAQESPRLNVRLVWGTMAEAAVQSGFEAIETRLAEKLREVFPWTSYYKILDKNLNTPENRNITETLSPKARLSVRNLGRARFRLRLFGEGNRVINKTLTVNVDDIVALAGYDEHKMGWFVVLKRAPADDESSW
ncbi:MAG: hypothetical protein ACI9VS_000631 [Candidatus Binatia bacterium]|jgi:hypothetical protein